jgi:hypothetical protein
MMAEEIQAEVFPSIAQYMDVWQCQQFAPLRHRERLKQLQMRHLLFSYVTNI